MKTAIEELLIQFWIVSTGVNARIYSKMNIIKYTSKNPRTEPRILLTDLIMGMDATKSSIEAMICNAILTAKKIIANAIAL